MEPEKDKKYYTNNLAPILEENGIDLDTVTSFPSCYKDNTPLRYTCVCDNLVERSSYLVKVRPLCDICCPTKKTGPKGISIEQYIELADECGFEYIKIEGEQFVNTKSSMTVRNKKTNKIFKKSYANLKKR